MAANSDRQVQLPPRHRDRPQSHINFESIGVRSNAHRQEIASLVGVRTGKSDRAVFDIPEIAEESETEKDDSASEQRPNLVKPYPGRERKLFRIKHQSPWQTYERGYDLKFDQFVAVATRKAPMTGKVTIRKLAGQNAASELDMLRRVDHERFVTLLEIMDHEKTIYMVFEHIFVSLTQVVNCPAYPTERQLAAILGQIIEGLLHLHTSGLRHGSLSSSNVLLKPDGEIKLANQESCYMAKGPDPSNVRAVGFITMELMQKYANDDGSVGVEDLTRWPANSKPVRFLSMTTSAVLVEELRQHELLTESWRKEDLQLLQELASFTVQRPYRYDERD